MAATNDVLQARVQRQRARRHVERPQHRPRADRAVGRRVAGGDRRDEVGVGRAAAAARAVGVHALARPGRPCRRSRTATPAPRGRPRPPAPARRAGTAAPRRAPMLQPTRCTRVSPSASTSAARSSAQSRTPRVASMGSGSVAPYPRRSTASTRCRPVAASSSSCCCQNSDELTLPCTKSTASPGPAGSTPSGCSTDWVRRLVANRRGGDAGQQDVVSWRLLGLGCGGSG